MHIWFSQNKFAECYRMTESWGLAEKHSDMTPGLIMLWHQSYSKGRGLQKTNKQTKILMLSLPGFEFGWGRKLNG